MAANRSMETEGTEIRLLRPEEIECRVGNISRKGLSLLLYKDARVDQRILDETFGPFGWRRSHQSIEGELYCTVEVFDRGTGEWVGKQDAGSAGKSEQERAKTMASDSFKRACVNWGIGRELYSAPFIWIPESRTRIEDRSGKYVCYEHFSVSDIRYDENREICAVAINGERGQRVYEWQSRSAGTGKKIPDRKGEAPDPLWNGRAADDWGEDRRGGVTARQIENYHRELERTGVTEDAVAEHFRVGRAEEMSPELYEKVMRALRATKERVA